MMIMGQVSTVNIKIRASVTMTWPTRDWLIYRQTCFIDHLSTKTTCLQRPYLLFPLKMVSHWSMYWRNLSTKTTCLQRPLVMFPLGGRYRQVWLYIEYTSLQLYQCASADSWPRVIGPQIGANNLWPLVFMRKLKLRPCKWWCARTTQRAGSDVIIICMGAILIYA